MQVVGQAVQVSGGIRSDLVGAISVCFNLLFLSN